jgi:hypothetical protein
MALSCGGSSTGPGRSLKVFDAVADFSSTTNADSSVWSYRYQNGLTRNGNYSLLPAYGSDVIETWTPTDPDAWRVQSYLPAIGVNRTGADVTIIGTGLTWPAGAMLVHPGSGQLVILTWTAPSEATAAIDFSFRSLHAACGNGIAWFVERNNDGGTLASGSLVSGVSSGDRNLAGVRLHAGDRINFVVDPNSDFVCDSTELTATVTTS